MRVAAFRHPQRHHSSMHTAYIGLGANLGAPAQQVRAALRALQTQPALQWIAQSPLYRSAPIGVPGQADYCNAVCAVQTALEPEALFDILIGIERAAGRVRDGQRWGPRVLDLDLLHVEGVARTSERLTLPHAEIARRNFVLVPLAQIAPRLEIPGLGRIADLAAKLGHDGLTLWQD